jgi:hypothetical protein
MLSSKRGDYFMAKRPPTELRAIDLVDAHGAMRILGCTRSRVHQYANEGRLTTYFFLDGDLVEAEGQERAGQISIFNRYEVGNLAASIHHKGGRPRKTSLSTS